MSTKANKKIMPISLTEIQREWLKAESARTGETMTAIIRNMIKEKMESK